MPKRQDTDRVERLHLLTKSQILGLWYELFKNEPPSEMRKDLLLRIGAQRFQEVEFGGLRETSCRRLRQIAVAVADDPRVRVSIQSPIKSETRMVRQ
jgi:hypothetical protein